MPIPHLLFNLVLGMFLVPPSRAQGFMSPFFMYCNYDLQSGDQSDVDLGQVALTLAIEGEPDYYLPEHIYTMRIASSRDFDGFQINAVFSMGPNMTQSSHMPVPFFGGSSYLAPNAQLTKPKRFLCSRHVHAHFGNQPQHELTFRWMAPPKGTGCISFQATATRNQQILFNGITVLHLCEQGSKIDLSTVHDEGLVFRDDFDSSRNFDNDMWSVFEGVRLSSECEILSHGKTVVACDSDTERKLVTTPLNMTTASVLQFATASGSCNASESGTEIQVLFGTENCSNWTLIDTVSVPKERIPETHILHLPVKARRNGVCIKWEESLPETVTTFEGCWALDNVAIVNHADPPADFQDDFDPMDPADWLFFSGAKIQHQCHSEKKAIVFDGQDGTLKFATTRDLNLVSGLAEESYLLLEQFNVNHTLDSWQVDGGSHSLDCSSIDDTLRLVFSGPEKTRRLCSPFMDLSVAGSVRFHFGFGDAQCSRSVSDNADVFVYVEDRRSHTSSVSSLSPTAYGTPKDVILTLSHESQMMDARICWIQKSHQGLDRDVWFVGSVQILTILPTEPTDFVQFDLNMNCGSSKSGSISLDYSTNHGQDWMPLYEPCRNIRCFHQLDHYVARFDSEDYQRWERVSLALPHAAMGPYTRFRWGQPRDSNSTWAIDNVYIGECPKACNNRGRCTRNGCVCDPGFGGVLCSDPDLPRPSILIQDFSWEEGLTHNFSVIRGASTLGYTCGIVATGKALVFSGQSDRRLETVDINTQDARYLQFSLRLGSDSMIGDCPSPDHKDEVVLLHYTCDGGVSWSLLREMSADDYGDPIVSSVPLPVEAQAALCQFRWWQPVHSGAGHDVWAIDDVSVTGTMYNTIDMTFDPLTDGPQPVEFHLGAVEPYCSRQHVLSFTGAYQENEYRHLMTGSMHIGPSYIIQFDLVMGCDYLFAPHLQSEVHLEYSTNHGMTWDLVRGGCWPPRMCEEYHEPSVYHPAEYEKWRRVALGLPQHTWSSSTRLRLRQPYWSFSDSWAIDNLYIGLQCPAMCGGHGYCKQAQCRCDEGYTGLTCRTETPLPSSMNTDFSLVSQLDRDWLDVFGGELAGANQGCGTMLSGESLFFFQAGPRKLTSRDLNTTSGEFLEFYIQLGGENDVQCSGIESREENVLVQYSRDGGVSWPLLKELQGPDYIKPSMVHIELPQDARGASVRFRWWQPRHSGHATDQWAIDQVQVGHYEKMSHLEDDFEVHDVARPVYHDLWQVLTDPMYAPYCGSTDDTLMFANQANDKIAMTKDLVLSAGDIVQFWINVGCSRSFSAERPVLLEYSHDAGMTWSLVQQPCYLQSTCHNKFSHGSIYYTGQYGEWQFVVLPVTENVAARRVNIRWWQQGGRTSSFALNDVYIGPPCPAMCGGHGMCVQGKCKCQEGYEGESCVPADAEPVELVERFEDASQPGGLWGSVLGAQLGTGCGVIGSGNSLYFHEKGPREARTIALNTTHTKMLQFTIRIGSTEGSDGCLAPRGRTEGVIVDYSHNNGIDWEVLRTLDPELYMDMPHVVSVPLPADAKTESTVIRWWQPLVLDFTRAEWAIDDVIIAVNDTSKTGFQENFNPMKNEIWYMAMNAIPRITCQSQDHALEFSKNGEMRYAETWDYQVTSATFLQFYIAMGCSGTYSTLYSVMLEYSSDMGQTWAPVLEECLPPKPDCPGYHRSSSMTSQAHTNWTRVTLYLPSKAVSPATRFRWLQETVTLRGNVWALDNIYLGDGCPWVCSGHGYCDEGVCVCDPGYFGIFCVPSAPLPMTLRDDFDNGLRHDHWPEVYGAEVTDICGLLVHGNTLTFYKDNLRMATTQDLDVSMATFIQFFFQYGCGTSGSAIWPREHTVLLQYSTNGGIVWHLLEDLHRLPDPANRYLSIPLPSQSRTNATKFRFWQPKHAGHMKSVWSVDDVFIGGSVVNPDSLMAMMDSPPNPEHFLFWPAGSIDQFCSFNVRPEIPLSNPVAMVFHKSPGEHSITTQDLDVNDMTVIQFELNVGCSEQVLKDNPVRLEYSTDFGKTWRLVIPPCTEEAMTCVQGARADPTVYYSGATKYWQRVVVSLRAVQICGTARFRWYQGYFSTADRTQPIPVWAIRNIYIGMQCEHQCNGHGTCIYGMACQCDDHYSGELCEESRHNPSFLKEDFDTSGIGMTVGKWFMVSGAEATQKCGTLAHGNSLHFVGSGVRMAMTSDLDLSTALILQFYIHLGCSTRPAQESSLPVYVQYSKDGGISWLTLQQFVFGPGSNEARYVALELPYKMKGPAVRVRWWQPAKLDGMFTEEWAIDQIYIGGSSNGRMVLSDDLSRPQADTWLMYPGAVVEPACGLNINSLHFTGEGPSRFAVTNDVTITEATYMQFYISMGCLGNTKCYKVQLQYSVDFGKTWHLLEEEYTTSDVKCTSHNGQSVYQSDVYSDWTRVTVELPFYTRHKATRFRFIQDPPVTPSDTWAITQLYIGDECVCSCGGHGFCQGGECKCDKGWTGSTCTDPAPALRTLLSDSFSTGPAKDLWISVSGALSTTECGVLASGPSLHFKGECTRQIISTDLDLRQAVYIHFNFRFGCVTLPKLRTEGVVLDFSNNGGKTWSRIIELYYDQYATGSYVMIDLPSEAKENGVRLRFWQPDHPASHDSDWAIDNIVIGGKTANPPQIQDTFSDVPPQDIWLQQDNTGQTHYCGSNDALLGIPQPHENVTLMTSDLDIGEGYILQFSISIGCNASWDAVISPVHLQYSVDYGMSWHYLQKQCLPYMAHCSGKAHTASVYYPNTGWRRVTLYLQGPVLSRRTRFRWCQPLMLEPDEAYRQHWALDDVYIGPACPTLCHGRGLCQHPHCKCDPGYGGEHCQDSKPNPTSLKDMFSAPSSDPGLWSLVQGGHVAPGCAEVVEGSGLHFSGPGQREAVTVDLDLRDARFVQYYALIGGRDSTRMECGTPKSRNESIVLQYSSDGGSTWHILHVLDYQTYWIHPYKDYIPLPPAARTQHTRVRWWQPHSPQRLPVGWTLDDVFIGGHTINPSQMTETFDEEGTNTVEFHPGGSLSSGLCGKKESSMAWPNEAGYRALTTQQMIIQDNYMLQFEIIVGCADGGLHTCGNQRPVILEYNKDPTSDVWDVVYPRCILNSHETNMECTPYSFRTGSVYTTDTHHEWTRVTLRLPPKVFSSQTRLRWSQQLGQEAGPSWALDHVYIGEQCPLMCQGRGACVNGTCVCDVGYDGDTCSVGRLPLRLSDGFEGGLLPSQWAGVTGGRLGMGCAPLSAAWAHGRNLYFSGCGLREAVTTEMDTSQATTEFWRDVMRNTWEDFMPLPLNKDDNHPCSLTHIFSDQYPAAYYSFTWAEMIAADIVKSFTDAGLSNTDKVTPVGKRFRDTYLSLGGGVPAGEVFRRFRGRDPSMDPFVVYHGGSV